MSETEKGMQSNIHMCECVCVCGGGGGGGYVCVCIYIYPQLTRLTLRSVYMWITVSEGLEQKVESV